MNQSNETTIIAAVIAAIGGIIVALINRGKKRRDEKEKLSTESIYKNPSILPEPAVVNNAISPQKDPSPESREPAFLPHRQIAAALKNIPPFQREKVRSTFVGATVSWRAHLMSVYSINDSVKTAFELAENRVVSLFCTSPSNNCDVLQFAPEDSIFLITGRIANVSEFNAELEDCKFVLSAPTHNSH